MQRCRFIFQIDSRTSYRYISDYDRTFDDKRRCHCQASVVRPGVAQHHHVTNAAYSRFQNVFIRGSQGVSRHLSSLNIIMANAVLRIPKCFQSWESRRQPPVVTQHHHGQRRTPDSRMFSVVGVKASDVRPTRDKCKYWTRLETRLKTRRKAYRRIIRERPRERCRQTPGVVVYITRTNYYKPVCLGNIQGRNSILAKLNTRKLVYPQL
jgi:hypothetical protein